MTTSSDDPRYWDVRTLERKLRQGLLSRKEFEKYLKALPDRADNATTVSAVGEEDDDDSDDDGDGEG